MCVAGADALPSQSAAWLAYHAYGPQACWADLNYSEVAISYRYGEIRRKCPEDKDFTVSALRVPGLG